MFFRSTTINRLVWPPIYVALFLFLVAGCKVEDKTWIDKMLSEMETALIAADQAGGGQEGRTRAVNQVVQRYFRPGMPKTDAFNLLRELKAQGFSVGEYRHDGARSWPDGELKPYMDEATKKNLQRQIPPETSRITATKQYGESNLLVTKHAGVTLIVRDGDDVILSSDGALGLKSL